MTTTLGGSVSSWGASDSKAGQENRNPLGMSSRMKPKLVVSGKHPQSKGPSWLAVLRTVSCGHSIQHLTRRCTGRQFRYSPWPPVSLVDSTAVELRFASLHRLESRRATRSGYQPVGAEICTGSPNAPHSPSQHKFRSIAEPLCVRKIGGYRPSCM